MSTWKLKNCREEYNEADPRGQFEVKPDTDPGHVFVISMKIGDMGESMHKAVGGSSEFF